MQDNDVIDLVIDQRRRDLGGFDVGRLLPYARRRMVGPFIFFDHMGPVDFAAGLPRSVDVRPHPHIGLATLTYLFDGEIMHRDSVGSEQAIRPGEVNWMIAGRGITHSERFEQARLHGGHMDGIQAWLALPDGQEEIAPAFHHHPADEFQIHAEAGAVSRVLAGAAYGLRSRVATFSPLFYVHQELRAGARSALPDGYSERAAYVARGEVAVAGRVFGPGQMIVFAPGADAVLTAVTPALLMLLGGEPVGERFLEWNFVSSSKERIAQAKADWQAGRMKLPDLDHGEFIALPADSVSPPLPTS
jgi:redox-sensitive bicupin YhaK (pirin superfamily)